MFQHPKVTNDLVSEVLTCKRSIEHTVHGLKHWQNVEANGLKIAQIENADASVVSLFALFHDSQRLNTMTAKKLALGIKRSPLGL